MSDAAVQAVANEIERIVNPPERRRCPSPCWDDSLPLDRSYAGVAGGKLLPGPGVKPTTSA
jgi:hypothetical protein